MNTNCQFINYSDSYAVFCSLFKDLDIIIRVIKKRTAENPYVTLQYMIVVEYLVNELRKRIL